MCCEAVDAHVSLTDGLDAELRFASDFLQLLWFCATNPAHRTCFVSHRGHLLLLLFLKCYRALSFAYAAETPIMAEA